MQPFFVRPARLAALLTLLGLGGCTTTAIEVNGSFPREAVIERLPLAIGVYFDEKFQGFTLEETIPRRGAWSIAIGSAQVEMFRSVLPAMFERVVELDSRDSDANVDAVLLPRVEDMQFAIPVQTQSNFFEVWIRYRLTLTEPGTDRVIASWPLTAYGRTRDTMLSSAGAALEQAAIVALRDAAALLAIDFVGTRELAPWLSGKLMPPADELTFGQES